MATDYKAGNSEVESRGPCSQCGSKDNLVKYKDGHSTCYSIGCGHFIKSGAGTMSNTVEQRPERKLISTTDLIKGTRGAIPDRRLSQDILDKFGVTIEYDAKGNVTKHHYPYYNNDNRIVALKTRVVEGKKFFCSGNLGDSGLFGQNVFEGRAGRYITVTEGELDALAVSSMFHGKWPVVSLKNGSGSAVKGIKESLEFLETFENVILCMDQDEAGREATKNIVGLFSPNKVKVMQMPLKDASEMLMKGKVKEFTECWWSANPHRPDGIVTFDDLIQELETAEEVESVEYPWTGLNQPTYGFRRSELVTITSGSGMGKSQLLRELQYHLYTNTTDNIGIMALEETPIRAGLGIASIMANKPLHLPEVAKEERIEWLKKIDSSRCFFWKHWGSTQEDNLFSRLRYMAKGLDCKWIILDHLSIVVSDQENPDERKAIDSVMTKLRAIVQETGVGMFLVSHLKRPNKGKGHEEGAQVSLAELRGSAAIAQLSDIVIGLERNQQHEDADVRNTTTLRVLKNRFTGLTGACCWLKYDAITGRMLETQKPDLQDTDHYDF